MDQNPDSRHSTLPLIFLLYFVPSIVLTLMSMGLVSYERSWATFGMGLFFSGFGTFLLFTLLLSSEEKEAQVEVVEQEDLSLELEEVKGELKALQDQRSAQIVDLEKKVDEGREEAEKKIAELEAEVEGRELLLKEKEAKIEELQEKIHDLSYEVKSLLQLAEGEEDSHSPEQYQVDFGVEEKPPHFFSPAPDEAKQQLKRCLDIAQKMTGGSPFMSRSTRFKTLPPDSFSLDLRRLFENLKSENHYPLFVYSLKEDKVLFANEQMKILTGWNADKFAQDFHHLVLDGKEEWRDKLRTLPIKEQALTDLVLKSREGEPLSVRCQIGTIPSGLFRNHLIGVLYQTDRRERSPKSFHTTLAAS